MLTKEYRICMPLSVEEYRVGQLYMIARHSHEQSNTGEGVEVVANEKCTDEVHGDGQYTEKRIHLNSRLPLWLQAMVPNLFYITEKSWNRYPLTRTEYTCSFIPKFKIEIDTRYEDNNGDNDNCLGLSATELQNREVVHIDIAKDVLPEKHYKKEEDCRLFKSEKTGRGPLNSNWQETVQPIMCSYKLTKITFEVWGLQTKVEQFAHKAVKDILLLGHIQAFAWIDDWYGLSLSDVRSYETLMQAKTNGKVNNKSAHSYLSS